MKLFDFGGGALALGFLVGLIVASGAFTIGEPVDSDSTPRGVIFSTGQ